MEKLLTRKETAEYLGISLTQLDEARKQKRISYVQYVQNGSVYFASQALEEYVARATHWAAPLEPNKGMYQKPRKRHFL